MRHALRLTVVLALAAVMLPADAQQRVHRVGVLSTGFSGPGVFNPLTASFEERLARMGYRDGQNLILERRWAEGKLERLPALTDELTQQKVEVLLTIGNKIQRIVQDANPRIPMVSLSCDSFSSVANYAKPNGNFTGVTCMSTELSPKRLELAKQLVPSASRAVYLHNPTQGDVGLGLTLDAARPLGIAIKPVEARSPAAEAGGLVSYGSTLVELGERAADLTAKILRGAKPHELPLEQATKVYLTVNLKAARALGYAFPQAILQRADYVIE